jgi:Fic family protein
MKIPQSPKSFSDLYKNIGNERVMHLLNFAPSIGSKDDYLHWNELRRRPTPEGLTHDEWWFLIKWGRDARLRAIPLNDKVGQPFKYALPDRLLEQLHAIDRGLGSAWNLPEAVTNPATRNEYVVSSLIQESITSSQLEGAVTTREVAKAMLRSGRPPRDTSERMILNNYRTMQRIMDLRDQPLTPELVFELHRRVTEDTLEKADAAGRFRRADEIIRIVDFEGTVYHEPPVAVELPDRLEAMCAFANGTTPDFFIHPVIRAIILHFWLAYDHPFVDGNGRTARALFYWAMLHQGFRLFEFISISQILLKAPSQYALSFLHTETDGNDLTYFIVHQAEVIQRAVLALHDYVNEKTARLKEVEKCLRGLGDLNHRQQSLLADALRHPDTRYTIEGHKNSNGVAYQTARTDLLDLVERGLMSTSKVGRAWVFRTVADMQDKLAGLATAPVQPDVDNATLPLGLKVEPKE